jgi:hypothetical protein
MAQPSVGVNMVNSKNSGSLATGGDGKVGVIEVIISVGEGLTVAVG